MLLLVATSRILAEVLDEDGANKPHPYRLDRALPHETASQGWTTRHPDVALFHRAVDQRAVFSRSWWVFGVHHAYSPEILRIVAILRSPAKKVIDPSEPTRRFDIQLALGADDAIDDRGNAHGPVGFPRTI